MIYSNYEFLLLFPAFLTWFYCARSLAAQNILLIIGSAVFLAWSGVLNLAVAAGVIAVVFGYVNLANRLQLKKGSLQIVVAALVLNLAYFKYRDFISSVFGVVFPVPSALAGIVPLGISFYTFEAISAAVDLRRRRLSVQPMQWSLFIMFFPHLIAGPIVRYRQLAPQFLSPKRFGWRNLKLGLHLFTLGFLKKLAADPLGAIIDPVWAAPAQASASALLLALLGFYVQVYADFSGYTDMGRGVARMLGYRLPINFRAPFFSVSPADLFRRWHVSLSSWIRTFVYDTLAVTVLRRVRDRKTQNYALLVVILFVMAIFGLWHGAAWHFVAFGVWLGLMIVGWTALTRGKLPRTMPGWIFSVCVLQLCWLIGLVLFRADTLPAAGDFFAGLFRPGTPSPPYDGLVWCLPAVVAAFAVQAVDYTVRRRFVARRLLWLRGSTPGAVLVLLVFVGALASKMIIDSHRPPDRGETGGSAFIYFRF